jgi:hypothetical protein
MEAYPKYVVCSPAIGDNIVISGGVNYLAEQYDGITLITHKEVFDHVKTFYLGTKVKVATMEAVAANSPDVKDVCMGFGNWKNFLACGDSDSADYPRAMNDAWEHWLYRQMEVPYEKRYTHCPIRGASRVVEQILWPEGFSFLHDDTSRGMDIVKFPHAIKFQRAVNMGKTILQYVHAIENAPEVHVIDSSFFHLTECLNPKGELFLHRYARHYVPVWHDCPTRHKWNIIEDKVLSDRSSMIRYLNSVGQWCQYTK